MTVLFRCRVDPQALAKADAVTGALGTKTAEVVRMFIAQIGTTGKVPLALDAAAPDDLVDRARRNKQLLALDDAQDW